MTFLPKTVLIAVCALAATLAGSPASAEILAAIWRAQNFFSSSTVDVAIPIRPNGGTALRFTTTGPGSTLVKITFNSECMVAAARGTWLTLRIEVDGIPTHPAAASGGADYAFCAAVDATGSTWMSVSRQSLISVPAGEHIVRVFARLPFGTGNWQLGDTSLVVEK